MYPARKCDFKHITLKSVSVFSENKRILDSLKNQQNHSNHLWGRSRTAHHLLMIVAKGHFNKEWSYMAHKQKPTGHKISQKI